MTGAVNLPEGQEMVMPGDNTNCETSRSADSHDRPRFAIREGGRTVGAGVGTDIIT
jgi:elongation factor Tu